MAANPLTIVIVSWNVAELLEDCLNSILAAQTPALQPEIIVIDNASSDNTVEIVRHNFPQVKLLINSQNYGFGRACNQGWRIAQTEFVFFLNPDATVAPDALQILIEFMQKNSQAVVAGPQLRYPDGTIQSSRRRFLSPCLAFVESTILQRYRPFKNLKAVKRFYMEEQSESQRQSVDWLVGAALLVRREVLEELGGFDERYFMYSEESDLCRQAQRLGQIWYIPEAVVTHQEGRSSAKNLAQRHINFHTSKVSYFRKWHGWFFAALLRYFLLATYLFQGVEEGAKFLVGHKRELRRERLQIVRQVLKSGLRPYRSPWPRQTSELKVGLISAEYWPQPGGVGDYTACLSVALKQAGVAKLVVITGPDIEANDLSQLLASGLKNPRLYPLGASYDFAAISNWKWGGLSQIKNSVQNLDVINIQYQTGAYGMHPAINFLPLYLKWSLRGAPRPRIVTTFHDLREPYLFPKAGPVRRWVTQILLRSSDYAVVTNPQDYAQALTLKANPNRLKLIPIGSNITPLPVPTPQERRLWRQKWGLEPAQFVIGYFGLLNQSKGVDILMEALARLDNINLKLLLIGGETGQSDQTNSAFARKLDTLIERLNLSAKIIRTGHLAPSETSQALYALDLAVLPFRDGASLRRGSLLATLAHGLPTLTSKERKIKRKVIEKENFLQLPQLSSGQNCYMVEPENAVQLAEAICLLYTDQSLRTRLGQNAQKLVQESFGWLKIATALLEVYLA